MAAELKFSKFDNTPWGFRLTGGKDYDMPLTVVKVLEGSLAEQIGLTEGDTVEKINEHCTSQMTHDEAHDVITTAGNNFIMAVVRADHQLLTNGQYHGEEMEPDSYQDLPPIDQDIYPIIAEVPYPQITQEFIDRSLTASPYFNPSKHYRPFSTEPIEGVPPVEDPIILDPTYHDDFSHIVVIDNEPETIFKLERVKHKPEGDSTITGKVYLEETRNQIKDEKTNMDGKLDLNAIEISAKEIVEDSIYKAVTVTEEIKREIDIELSKSSTNEVVTSNIENLEKNTDLTINTEISEVTETKQEVESPKEKQIWVMTAEYDSEEYERRRSSIKAEEITIGIAQNTTISDCVTSATEICSSKSEQTDVKMSSETIQTSEETILKGTLQESSVEAVADSQIGISIVSKANVECLAEVTTVVEATCNIDKSHEVLQLSEEKHVTESSITEENEITKSNKRESEETSTEKNGISEVNEQNLKESKTIEMIQNLELSDIQQKQEEERIKSSTVQDDQRSESKNQSSEVSKQDINKLKTKLEESELSLQQIKQQTLQAANTITEETKLRTIQRQIPSITSVPSQHYTDQLLRTFFVHLTDVMIALSSMVVAESGMSYGSRSVSPMRPQKQEIQNVGQVEQTVTETRTTQAQKIHQSSAFATSGSLLSESQLQNTENQTEVRSRIIGSTEEVEKLVESVEKTRMLAESVQQARKVSITAEQSQMLAESAEQLRRLSLTAEQTIKQDLAHKSEIALENLSNELSQVSDMVNEEEFQVSSECNLRRESKVIETNIVEKDSLDWGSEKDSELHTLSLSSEDNHIVEVSEQNLEIQQESVDIQHESVEITQERVTLESEAIKIKQESTSSEVISSIEISTNEEQETSTEEIIKEAITLEQVSTEEDVAKVKELPEPLDLKPGEKVLQRTVSDNSDSGIIVDPPTPLTDEYVFKLDIHVKGLKSRTPTPSPEPPQPEVEFPPEHVSKKPKLKASITTEIESSAVDTNPASIQTNVETSIDRDDLSKENEKDLHMPAADANSLQLPRELDPNVKTDETKSYSKEVEENIATKQTKSDIRKESKVELNTLSAEQAEFRSVEVVIEDMKNSKVEVVNGAKNGAGDDEGKPGLTDDEIAVIISGEAEMLKEAHVLGLKRVIASHMNRVKDDEEDDDPCSVNFKKIMPQCSFIKDSEVFKALNEEAVKTREEQKKEERKWTTFLQRPDRPVPRKPGQTYLPEPKEKYVVKIVKQPKPKVAPDYPKSFETGLLPWEERLLNQSPPPPVEQEPPILVPEESPEYLEALDNLPESAVPDLEDTGFPLPPERQSQEEEEDQQLESQEEALANQADVEDNQGGDTDSYLDQTTESNLDVLDNMVSEMDPNLTPEEQLAQIQAQLIALSQLPAAIQQTLDIVTKQLGQLVPQATAKKQDVVAQEETTDDQRTDVDQGLTTDEERLDEVSQEPSTEEIESRLQEDPVIEAPPEPQIDQEEVERLKREEAVKITEQRKIDKQKKDLMAELQLEHQQRQVKQRPTPRVSSPRPAFGPLAPQERPIFLPGGRKWRGPKDAFNDAFIAETLTKQAEIIQGKTLGVNFMKYEKPPVSLEHLKDSDVYKMVHDMDTGPLKAIEKKSTIAIAEEEFREKCRSVTPTTALERQEMYEDHTVLPQQVQP